MELESLFLHGDAEDGKYSGWKTTDDSIWVSLDFPRVCVETLITTAKACGKKSCSMDCQDLDPVLKSEMFSCVLENARRKLEEAIGVSCKRPCCIEPSLGQGKRCSSGPEVVVSDVAPWDPATSGVGFRDFSKDVEISEILLEVPVKGGTSFSSTSYFTQGASLWQTDGAADVSAAEMLESPPEGLFYVLPFLLLKDLLSVEQVCKSLKEAVSQDPLLWRHLKVDTPLSAKLTDSALLKLASRSQGRLESLVLIDCLRISEEAVEKVVTSNPMLSKIFLPGCIRINVDAVVRMAEFLARGKAEGRPGLKQVRIRGVSGITKENLEQLQIILGVDKQQKRNPRPHFYSRGNVDERPIDVQACPRCKEPRPVYDCPRKECRNWEALKVPECRACIFCIGRCEDCGTCIDQTDYEETFCLRILCRDCWLRLPKCLECNRPGRESGSDRLIRTEAMFVCPDCESAYNGSSTKPGARFYVV